MDILYLIDRLDNLIAGSRRMPFVNQMILVKESEIFAVIEQMRTSIPEEIKQARRILQEKERIIAQAQAEATHVLSRAREESERVLNREGLLAVAEERSQEIIQQASLRAQEVLRRSDEEAERLKNDADTYVTETLQALREHLLSIETDLGRSILSIERGLESMQDENQDPPQTYEQTEHITVEHPPRESPPNMPRRASLAADTMGGPLLPL
jgi:cell division septum initiation protein DivIVA